MFTECTSFHNDIYLCFFEICFTSQAAWMLVEHPDFGQLMRRARKRKAYNKNLGIGLVGRWPNRVTNQRGVLQGAIERKQRLFENRPHNNSNSSTERIQMGSNNIQHGFSRGILVCFIFIHKKSRVFFSNIMNNTFFESLITPRFDRFIQCAFVAFFLHHPFVAFPWQQSQITSSACVLTPGRPGQWLCTLQWAIADVSRGGFRAWSSFDARCVCFSLKVVKETLCWIIILIYVNIYIYIHDFI